MSKVLTFSIGLLLFVLIAATAYGWWQMRDRHPGYAVDITIAAPADAWVSAGFAAVSITPDIIDTCTDVSGNFIASSGGRCVQTHNKWGNAVTLMIELGVAASGRRNGSAPYVRNRTEFVSSGAQSGTWK